MVYSRLDQFYRSLLLSKFFTKGWGKPDNLKRIFEFRKVLSNREACQALVEKDYPISIDKDYRDGDCRILEGHFRSPFVDHMPGIMPKEVETASFQAILPVEWQHQAIKPICVHLAGTGDHFFWRRRLFTARPLLKEAGIASILLENPYYGSRKPKSQLRSSLHNVSDLFVMGGALVLESIALLRWCERQGWGPLGLSGVSMGGHMASLAATNWEEPISLIPCLSWSTASCVFTQGVLSGSIPWKVLQEQFYKNNLYQDEISKLIVSPEKAYQMGQQFVIDLTRDFNNSTSGENHQTSSIAASGTAQSSPTSSPPSSTEASIQLSSQPKFASISSQSSNSVSADKESSSSSSSSSSPTASPDLFHLSSQNTMTSSQPNVDTTSNFQSQETSESASSFTASPSRGGQKTKHSREEARRLTLNYAQTKQSQQSGEVSGPKAKKRLTLGHAVAKSKILFSRSSSKAQDEEALRKKKNLQEESFEFMRGVMDECTHLGNFSVPVDPELVIIVSATQDAYIPREGVLPLDKLWPGCEVRYVDQGHIGAVLLYQNVFRKAVIDAFEKQIKKYHPQHSHTLRRRGKPSRKQYHF